MPGKRKHTPPCSSEELFVAEKKWGHRGKIAVVDMVFLVSYRVFCIHHRPGKFLFEARKVLQMISFRWWSCTLFSSLKWGPTSRIGFATRAAIYRSLRTLRARNRKKVSKRVFLGVCRKVSKNTRKSLKTSIFGHFWVFLDFFRYFWGLFCGPPKRPFLRLFCDFGPGGSGDSCEWRLGSQHRISNC